MLQSRKNHSDPVKKSSFEKRSDYGTIGPHSREHQSGITGKRTIVICLVIAIVLAFAITFAYALDSDEPTTVTVEEEQAKVENASSAAYISSVIQEQIAKAQAQSDSNIIAVQNKATADAFAIWARGRFAVTDLSGDKLLFEVDPKEEYTAIWTALGVDGSLVVRGTSELAEVTASGPITTKREIVARDITSVRAIFESIQSHVAELDDVVMATAGIDSLSAKTILVDSLTAAESTSENVEAKTASIESLVAGSISTKDLTARNVNLESLFCPLACIDDLETGVLSAKDLEVENFTVGHVSAQKVSGVWESWSLMDSSSGSVVFPGIDSDGRGFMASQKVTVPADTTALFLQAGVTGGDWVCAWATRQISKTEWEVCCRYPRGAYEEMAAGTFDPVEEVRVYWCALSVAS